MFLAKSLAGADACAHPGRVRIHLHDDPGEFARLARPVLDTDPVRHTLALTLVERLRCGGLTAALMLTVHRRGQVAGVALRTAGRPVAVSALPACCAAAADAAAAGVDPVLDGVVGPVEEARAYAAAVAARTGADVDVAMRQRLFRLCSLQAPLGVTGSARRAGPGDVELLAAWQAAFIEEATTTWPPSRQVEDQRPAIADAVAAGAGIMLWEVGGTPVAYASTRAPVAGMSRVGPVYTVPEHRGHGYGSAVTAAATAWALAAGALDVVLFTDLDNPVSNAIYPRIGYRPVHDAVELTFRRRDRVRRDSASPPGS